MKSPSKSLWYRSTKEESGESVNVVKNLEIF